MFMFHLILFYYFYTLLTKDYLISLRVIPYLLPGVVVHVFLNHWTHARKICLMVKGLIIWVYCNCFTFKVQPLKWFMEHEKFDEDQLPLMAKGILIIMKTKVVVFTKGQHFRTIGKKTVKMSLLKKFNGQSHGLFQ